MREDIESVLYTEEEIRECVRSLGKRISADYAGKCPIFIGVLKGSFVFMADLMRNIDIECEVDFMAVSSYGNGFATTGAVRILKDLNKNVEGRDVVIVEDILDSGVTLSYLKGYITARRPNSIKICTLLDKPSRRKADITPDYVGFNCPDAFIVGYGLDYAEKYRNLPYIGILQPQIYS